MNRVVTSTGPSAIPEAGAAVLAGGGNAVDAVVAAALAWPPALASAGGMVVVGPGFGRGSCAFPARNPGFGLSRPRRTKMLVVKEPASLVAVPCMGKAMAAALTRWGSIGLPVAARTAAKAAAEADAAPHAEALELLANDGPHGFVRGAWGESAARFYGPLAGGLLTRRDLIEIRPELGEAFGPVDGLWLVTNPDRIAPGGSPPAPGQRTMTVIARDGRGALAVMVLESGSPVENAPPEVMGIAPNTLLAGVPTAQIKKVGQPLPLRLGAAAGGEGENTALGGTLAAFRSFLSMEREYQETPPEGLLLLKITGGRHIDIQGATSVRHL